MNFEETEEAIKVMQAHVDGEEIFSKVIGGFESYIRIPPLSQPVWNWQKFIYSIKPKAERVPVKGEMIKVRNGVYSLWYDREFFAFNGKLAVCFSDSEESKFLVGRSGDGQKNPSQRLRKRLKSPERSW